MRDPSRSTSGVLHLPAPRLRRERDRTLKVWELASGRALAALEGHTGEVNACAVTPDGRHVVSTSWDQTLKVWELASGRALTTLAGHTDVVTACTVTPDGQHVISASWDQTLKVWELATGRARATLEGFTTPTVEVDVVALKADAHPCLIAGAGIEAKAEHRIMTPHLLAVGKGRQLEQVLEEHTAGGGLSLEGHAGWVTACAVTPDGRHVVSASQDKTLKVWELASGRALATLEGHTGVVTACAVMPDGRHMVSVSWDQTLKVWAFDTYVCRLTHRGDAGYLAVAATTTMIIAGDSAGSVWFLDARVLANGRPNEATSIKGIKKNPK
ncbi:MAG TPA: WD40 repeat domain-containing protein [Kofleriaceae bacterium]